MSNSYLGKQLVRKADLGEGILIEVLENYIDIDTNWLLNGKGKMFRKEVDNDALEYLKKMNELQVFKIKQLEEEYNRFKDNINFVKENN